ncbi:unnamed protein product, partial [marine sediment metagenome]
CHHIYVKLAEYVRMLRKSLGKTLAGFDSTFQIKNDVLKFLFIILLSY